MQAEYENYTYLTDRYSVAAISRETGLPYRTLLAARSNYQVLDYASRTKIGSLYKSTTTDELSSVGFSRSQARKMNELTPAEIDHIKNTTKERVDYFATGNVMRSLGIDSLDLSDRNILDLYNQYAERIRSAIARNQTSYDWLQDPKY